MSIEVMIGRGKGKSLHLILLVSHLNLILRIFFLKILNILNPHIRLLILLKNLTQTSTSFSSFSSFSSNEVFSSSLF